MYKSRLLIYDAGDTRTTWVSFWKAMALLQFGTTLVFAVPPLWNNENQPDPRLRKAQAILGKTVYFIFCSRLQTLASIHRFNFSLLFIIPIFHFYSSFQSLTPLHNSNPSVHSLFQSPSPIHRSNPPVLFIGFAILLLGFFISHHHPYRTISQHANPSQSASSAPYPPSQWPT